MTTELLLYITSSIAVLTCIIMIILLVVIIKTNIRYKKFTSLSEKANIEEVLIDNQERIKVLQKEIDNHDLHLSKLDEQLKVVYSKMAITKYNAFDGLGGQMSAIVVLLNDLQDGMLLHSIHTGEGNHLYTKIIEEGKCSQTLSKEENDTLKKAIESNIL